MGLSGEKQYIFTGLLSPHGNGERFAFLPGGYPGKELVDSLFSTVVEINTIGSHHTRIWTTQLKQNHPGLELVEDRDNFDYVYDRTSLVELTGQSLHKKLVHVHHFAEDHPNRVLAPAHLVQSSDMLEVLDAWASGKDSPEDVDATKTTSLLIQELGLSGGVLYANDKPVAFTLSEQDGPQRVVIHIEKAAPGYRGIYQYINRSYAASLPESVVEINREQDLGIPGLRQAKMTYTPKDFIRKYKVVRQTGS